MKKSTKTKAETTKEASEPEEVEDEVYDNKTNLIYNFFNFFIGGSNQADIKNKQEGKPGAPPYGP
jgi:hypothetical protein